MLNWLNVILCKNSDNGTRKQFKNIWWIRLQKVKSIWKLKARSI